MMIRFTLQSFLNSLKRIIIAVENYTSLNAVLFFCSFGQLINQLEFCVKISIIISMVIQVFMGDVGYHCDIKFARIYPELFQTMGSCFQYNMRNALINHFL